MKISQTQLMVSGSSCSWHEPDCGQRGEESTVPVSLIGPGQPNRGNTAFLTMADNKGSAEALVV